MKQNYHYAFHDIISSLEANQNKIALVDKDGESYTYSDFKRKITGSRAHLKELGVKKGTKVLVFVTMSMELYTVLEALFSLGAIVMFVDPWMKGRKMQGIIKEIEPELLIINKKAAKYSWLLPATWKLKKWKIKELPENNDAWEIEDVENKDSALITFTSGSTGKIKGANRTYEFIDAQAQALKSKLIGKEGEQNIDYTNLPIVALAGFANGNTVIIPKINLMKIDQANSTELIEHLHEVKASRLVVSPALLKKILIGIKDKGKGSLEKVYTGGAPISPQLIKDCIENHSDIYFECIYGSTEVEPISGAAMSFIHEKMNTPLKGVPVGYLNEFLDLKIVEFKSDNMQAHYLEEKTLKKGETGEILVKGKHVNDNYYKNEQAFKRFKVVDKNGEIWHRTGDIGYYEVDQLYLVGRENRIYKKENKIIYPFPIEQFIQHKFDLTDIGYVQNSAGKFILFVGSAYKLEPQELKEAILEVNYPIDEIRFWNNPLPRDPRHKSKLMIERLIK